MRPNLILIVACFAFFACESTTKKEEEVKTAIAEAIQNQPDLAPAEVTPRLPSGNDSMVVDCAHRGEILQAVFDSDQSMRKDRAQFYTDLDRENLQIVINLLEQCGMPTLKDVNSTQMTAIWLVFQHADNSIRRTYFTALQQAAKNGDIKKSNMAMMEDRILMEDGQPQIYGTQITRSPTTGALALYKVADMDHVDEKRKAVGLDPLAVYLNRWNISLDREPVDHTGHDH